MNETFQLSLNSVKSFLFDGEIEKYDVPTSLANKMLHDKTGLGNEFLGWVDLPKNIGSDELSRMQQFANNFSKTIDYLVVIGIGGSYLGAKAVLEALNPYFPEKHAVKVLFAGHNINQDYLFELNHFLKDKNFGICVISKSGTTTEPALAFRLLKQTLEEQAGKASAQKKIIAITDESKGALRSLAEKENYATYVIPDDVGGRYSVLTPVGLIPIAIAGFDIAKLVDGALQMHAECNVNVPFDKNPAAQYAAVRNALYLKSFETEILVNYNDKLHFIAEWWKQLFGESEGKENKGIFPASVDFSTDLHSMGQYIQEGKRNIFETVISVKNPHHHLEVTKDKDNLDKLNFLAEQTIDHVNKMAELGTRIAHTEGGVPNILIEIDHISEFTIGQIFYFFEKACGIGGYLLNVNPFDQPGVEAYKNNMFALLNKPGFEKQSEIIRKKL
jgi:glucose-6-phosphate isomerase